MAGAPSSKGVVVSGFARRSFVVGVLLAEVGKAVVDPRGVTGLSPAGGAALGEEGGSLESSRCDKGAGGLLYSCCFPTNHCRPIKEQGAWGTGEGIRALPTRSALSTCACAAGGAPTASASGAPVTSPGGTNISLGPTFPRVYKRSGAEL
jgi:hypothetical protein